MTSNMQRRINGYNCWRAMKKRCYDSNNDSYNNYGRRGKFVCHGLKVSYPHFINTIGDRPSITHSIDRINNRNSYTCGTCQQCIDYEFELNIKWATKSEQIKNRDIFDAGNRCISKTRHGRYRARLWINGKQKQIGNFKTLFEAQKARDDFVALIK